MALIKVGGNVAVSFDGKIFYPSDVIYRVIDTKENKANVESNSDITIIEPFSFDVEDKPVVEEIKQTDEVAKGDTVATNIEQEVI